eukprot:TRINITY_DN5304_c0_g1_i1.p1 TRINITY_DN5304_c0_g1~~TRINITY_DN5304_c0_g1_i1.p1  ORF type:complete len:226 (+),score=8.58 TRINITY_DN5304_c0_g1_i1:51-728(+)
MGLFKFQSLKKKDLTSPSLHLFKSHRLFSILFLWRFLSFILCIIAFVFSALHEWHTIPHGEFFIRLTNVCTMLLIIYFLMASLFSIKDYKRKRDSLFISIPASDTTTESLLYGMDYDDTEDSLNASSPRKDKAEIRHKITWVLFEFCFTACVFVDVLFWVLMYTPPFHWTYVIMYGVNGFLITIELLLNSLVSLLIPYYLQKMLLYCYLHKYLEYFHKESNRIYY